MASLKIRKNREIGKPILGIFESAYKYQFVPVWTIKNITKEFLEWVNPKKKIQRSKEIDEHNHAVYFIPDNVTVFGLQFP